MAGTRTWESICTLWCLCSCIITSMFLSSSSSSIPVAEFPKRRPHHHLSSVMWKWLSSSSGNQDAQMCCLRDSSTQHPGCLRFAWTSLIKSCHTEGEGSGDGSPVFVMLIIPSDQLHLLYVVVLVLNFLRKYRLEKKNLESSTPLKI